MLDQLETEISQTCFYQKHPNYDFRETAFWDAMPFEVRYLFVEGEIMVYTRLNGIEEVE